ncbi:hypothetical protein [Microbacterium sp. GXF0217]
MAYFFCLLAGCALTVGIYGLVVNLRTLGGLRQASGEATQLGVKTRQSLLMTYGRLGGSALLVPVAILVWLIVVSSGSV